MGAQWSNGLQRRTDDRVVLDSNPSGGTSLRNFGSYVYPALPVSFGEDMKSHRSLLHVVCIRGSNISHTGGKLVTCR